MKTLFHVDERQKWTLVIRNVNNFLKADAKTKIEIVANSDAVLDLLAEQNQRQVDLDAIQKLIQRNIKICACSNSLNRCCPNTKLISGVEPVTAGVLEITKKQSEGYAYIKP